MLKVPVLMEGVRLRLRRSTPMDAPWTFAAARDEEVMRYLDWPAHRTESEARSYLEGCAARWDAGTEFHWMIEHKASATTVGSIACRPKGHAVDFGYFLARPHWGQGLGSEAARLLVGWLQRQPSVWRIWATADIDNTRSAEVLRKAGLTQEGVMRKASIRPNFSRQTPAEPNATPRDTALFAWARNASPAAPQESA
jgi:[ribosomal protein S5]-alanine N-acetyltransferase